MEKQKYPIAQVLPVADKVLSQLEPYCEKLCIAGSVRRKKAFVGDIEILAIPKFETLVPYGELFGNIENLLELKVQEFIEAGIFKLRVKSNGTTTNGHAVKLLVDTKSNIPVDIFITTKENWYSALVCRTGGKLNNEEIAGRAKKTGYRWKMSGCGFEHAITKQMTRMDSEEAIFNFVGLPYLPPEERS